MRSTQREHFCGLKQNMEQTTWILLFRMGEIALKNDYFSN